jgi:hypothetical protein
MRIQLTFLRLGRLLLGVAAVACIVPVHRLHAQTKAADVEVSRAAKRASTATFLDRKRSDTERLEAVKNLGYPEAETLVALLAVGADRTQSDTIRWEALRRVHYSDKYLDTVLKILADPQDGGEELDANLIQDLNQKTAFRLPASDQQRIQTVERKLLGDKRDKVRLYAYRALVSNHDQVALNQLVDGLRRGGKAPIPLPDAIALLDDDGSASYIGTLRPYLSHGDPRVQARAARALALDPESRPKIVELAKNPGSPEEVRLNALRGLAREDGGFASYAIPIVENPRESADVRYAAMHDFAGRLNYNKVDPADQVRFAEAVEKLAGDPELKSARGTEVKEAARKLHLYLKQAFPEIQKHYEKP